ncbi:hypothetical protein A3D45_02185 [Candidatus Falkowbacteria bacterium RIFCSPHIGHO2_02_FULL_42_9]|uniref:Uncharacterized protein n=2 Tax=Candidatus Falkowiibacteriota TaxID=1752728 RepID=A0A1F5S934_9BACT|nr:MAG: hypothetical protein UU43_C0015G0011 [Candidatus Falkowbacteria bacterium GW2011_GWA2_41_14]OGF23215.1 MAG: hypothetical protein A3D45_02185 [Candidatus Falkowbacteria bacterium RIFCSPHIGHO2_02_FULL_42_9]
MGIKDLPSVGRNFKASSFKSKFEAATGYGELKSLGNNPKTKQAIISAATRYQGKIRSGEFSRLLKTAVSAKIRASDKTLTFTDKDVVKKIFDHLSRGTAAKAKKPVKAETSVRASDRNAEQVKKNIARSRYDRDANGRQFYGTRYGGRVLKRSIGATTDQSASAGEEFTRISALGVKRQATGFAQEFGNKIKLTGSTPQEAPLKGTRPVDL